LIKNDGHRTIEIGDVMSSDGRALLRAALSIIEVVRQRRLIFGSMPNEAP
jgi:hypothetical protein